MKNLLYILLVLLCWGCDNIDKSVSKKGTIMAIFAHPDDERTVAPILSKYAKLGHPVYIVVATDGQNGTRDFAGIPAGDTLKKVRYHEMICAAEKIGAKEPIFLDYVDGDLPKWENVFSLDDKIDSLFMAYQPEVVITFGPDGLYGHPDHRMMNNIVTEVFQKQRSSRPQKLLYMALPDYTTKLDYKFKTGKGSWFKENLNTTDSKYLTYRIPYERDDFEHSKESYFCHASQYTPDEMDDLVLILESVKDTVYLRPFYGEEGVKYDLFD